MKKYLLQLSIAISAGLLLLLTGCAATKLEQPLPEKTKIAILSKFDTKAQFKHIGTTAFNNNFYEHNLPIEKINQKMTQKIYNLLLSHKYIPVLVDQDIPFKNKFLEWSLNGGNINEDGRNFLAEIHKKYNVNYLILITPGVVNINDNSELCYIQGYGLFYRSFFMIERTFIGGSIDIYLFDIEHNKFWVQRGDFIEPRSSQMWKDKFAQISKNDLKTIENAVNHNLPNIAKDKTKDMMLL